MIMDELRRNLFLDHITVQTDILFGGSLLSIRKSKLLFALFSLRVFQVEEGEERGKSIGCFTTLAFTFHWSELVS